MVIVLEEKELVLNTKRITFQGKSAIQGRCKCGKILIITDPNPNDNGSFETHHQAPMCEEYQKQCANAEPMNPQFVEIDL